MNGERGLIVALVAVCLGIPLLVIVLATAVFQDEQDRAATACTRPGGVGGDRLAPAGSFIQPVDPTAVTLTSGFGDRGGAQHQGIDLAGPIGTPIYAAADGVVSRAGAASGFGQWVVLDHSIDGRLTSTVYGHIESYSVQAGQQVRAGQQIATLGNRGESTGPHLHWEVWSGGRFGGTAVDPLGRYEAAPAPGQSPSSPTPAPSDPRPAPGGGDLSQPLPVSAGSEQNMQVGTKRLIRALHQKFGDRLDTLGGWRAGAGGYADHPSGQAVDAMIPDYRSGTGVATGDAVLDYVMANADYFYVEYAIWRQTYYPAAGTPNRMEDRGSDTENHFDHVHITVRGGGYDDADMNWGSAPGGTGSASTAAADCVISGRGLGDTLAAGTVPAEFEPWLSKAGRVCPQITPSLLAAQLSAENGFRYGANAPISTTGALGPAQFMPATWATYGKDYDGNGTVDVNAIGDAVMAQGHYMCDIAGKVDRWIAEGTVTAPRGRTELYLAGYNAGEYAVRTSGGFPSGSPDYVNQTRPYVDKILAGEARYRSINQ